MKPPEVDRAAGSRAAVAARRARAEVKRQVASRERTALDVAQSAWAGDPVAPEATLRVSELLKSVPTLGPTRTERVMAELGIATSKRVGGLGSRQRIQLRDYLLAREGAPSRPRSRLVVLAGPTAVGKGTVSRHIRETYPDVLLSVSATTRPPRPGEIDGEHYYFVSDAEFDAMIERASSSSTRRCTTPRDTALRDPRSTVPSPTARACFSRSICRARGR
jgi:guanylate kinase